MLALSLITGIFGQTDHIHRKALIGAKGNLV